MTRGKIPVALIPAAAIAGAITSFHTASNSTVRPATSLRPNGMAMKHKGSGIEGLPAGCGYRSSGCGAASSKVRQLDGRSRQLGCQGSSGPT